MVAYTFDGYWKDVGTINSLFESNMDLLGDAPKFDISDPSWRIRSRNPIAPPQYIGKMREWSIRSSFPVAKSKERLKTVYFRTT